ncbi:uncharacterized protein SPPG_07692 [Spizellomyces punctatus DAOM BR117]|uniref:Uncharacterized protein n=1 Tax=Spizellomyces punctatus (strain DAOM BR117) TaxID=645134 RepID=A0A0L0H5R9_SPIPD|nr:uncharacterized protein SPPG_07692 [Spizellomyces punctatus DAOM BR117]KNC96860.1 hypothetical protein SPPG_07692 [Spizellomyces punctatus DAOM BR117]|eukprot:XP_016604900.1 hypothetical protein SPPG_07692 [Spizellomyces punctatus DAOM BR117]
MPSEVAPFPGVPLSTPPHVILPPELTYNILINLISHPQTLLSALYVSHSFHISAKCLLQTYHPRSIEAIKTLKSLSSAQPEVVANDLFQLLWSVVTDAEVEETDESVGSTLTAKETLTCILNLLQTSAQTMPLHLTSKYTTTFTLLTQKWSKRCCRKRYTHLGNLVQTILLQQPLQQLFDLLLQRPISPYPTVVLTHQIMPNLLVPTNSLHSLIKMSFDGHPNSLWLTCEMLALVGKRLDKVSGEKENNVYYRRLRKCVENANVEQKSRMAVTHLLQLRKTKWIHPSSASSELSCCSFICVS